MNKIEQNIEINFYNKIAGLLKEARKSIVHTVNRTMVYTYFEIGRLIVELKNIPTEKRRSYD